jgi:hypothetical protein
MFLIAKEGYMACICSVSQYATVTFSGNVEANVYGYYLQDVEECLCSLPLAVNR